MKHIMVNYTVKKDKLDEVKKAIVEFVNAVHEKDNGTLLYEAFQNGHSFVHFMSFENGKAEKGHRNAEHTKKFVGVLYPNCEKDPEFTELKEVK